MKAKFLILLSLTVFTNMFAQRTTDIDGTKDYPLVSRFEGSIIEFYKSTKWDDYKLPVYSNSPEKINYEKPMKLEGKIMRWQYSVSPDNNPAYVMKNFEVAFKKRGFKLMFKGKPGEDFEEGPASFDGDFYGGFKNLNLGRFGFAYNPIGNHKALIIAKTNNGDKDIYVVEVISDFSNITLITQDIIEVEATETVTVKNLSDGISQSGHLAIYDIYFDSGKYEIKQKSAEAMKNIAAYLKAHANQKYLIVGHTDNIGDFDANIKLSLNRANAVVESLVHDYGVKATQLKAYGDGLTAPVSSNKTDKGRAKNRRVEIVKL